jgi:NAD(P)-dependent dehydrogenase (short-subunit alcohol dehydrogenase family)
LAASPADPSLQGRVCIVTGAAHGLGRAMAQALLDAGARVVAMDVVELGTESAKNTGRLLNIRGDVSSLADCKGVVDRTLQHFGAIHVLVNNAGIGTRAINPDYDVKALRFWELSPEGWHRIVAVNLIGAFNMAHAATPHMIAAGFGRIVNISTGPETMARYGDSPYGPSKAALESCTAIWAKELAETGVTCNALAPGGPVDTALARGSIPGRRKSAFLQADIMAPPVLWLASDRSARWTGRRFVARNWDPALPPDQAAAKAASPACELPAII